MDLRPADPAETAEAWRMAIDRRDGPSFLALTRQKVPAHDAAPSAPAAGLRRGGYILLEAAGGSPEAILIASGSEVGVAVAARDELQRDGIPTRVVSLPSWFLFQRQDPSYRDHVLPPTVAARVSIEAGATLGWERWIGSSGVAIGLDHFGASAPYDILYERFGITPQAVVRAVEGLLARHA
jgi:transketolase